MTKKLGLVLGSGAARGWAHIGVLRGLKELGVKPDVIAGCSVGALIGGAYLIDALPDFEAWARELKPLSALSAFSLKLHKGGFIDAAPSFEAFREFDQNIEDLKVRFGAVAADLGTGEEVWIKEGSVIDAARASSAIPVVFHAIKRNDRWLVDGAMANPAPVSLARDLGADIVICVDLNAKPRVLGRFDPPPPSVPALRDSDSRDPNLPAPTGTVADAVSTLIVDTRRRVEEQLQLFKSRQDATPYLFETAYAAADIFQMHLARAHAQTTPADILLTPDMRDAMPTAFDRADEFIERGREALMAERKEIEALLG